MTFDDEPLVRTIKERCKACYTCVRGCPAKAIRISGGQAEVIKERCIGCANCVLMCSRGAKETRESLEAVKALLRGGAPVAAAVAPSFPVEFGGMDPTRFAGILKAMGFKYVCEVAFGADMVSLQYRKLLNENPGKKFISTACPAVVSFVEKYHPALVPSLAPIVSPMGAEARIIKAMYGPEVKVVFIGPCVAKKGEALRAPEIEESITFVELRALRKDLGLDISAVLDAHFDPPHPAKGVLYPMGGGLLDSAELQDDLLSGRFLSAEGLENFPAVLKNMEHGDIDADFLDLLCCDGCIMGPGISAKTSKHAREAALRRYARKSYFTVKINDWEDNVRRFRGLDYSASFAPEDRRMKLPTSEELRDVLSKMGKTRPEDELNCGACGYPTCAEHAVAIIRGIAESEMCLPYTIDRLKATADELTVSYNQLGKTRQALMQSEKLASMGQLAAGVAHELNNPLGVVLLYSHLLAEQCEKGSRTYADARMITEQADRCKKIVGGLLNFARKNKPFFRQTDLARLVENYFRSAQLPPGVKLEWSASPDELQAEMDPDQIIQVLTNLVTNALEAMSGSGTLTVRAFREGADVCFSVADTGCGIKPENFRKVFEPFFTTKQIGKGTGLGLAVSYGIIKVHRGNIAVESNSDPAKGPTGTVFKVKLPTVAREAGAVKVKPDAAKK
ncbi:MAG: [Fe-Fe] hydrogenase large subunit C-terminal domain-containing protein [Elusimicrobiales bacterium]|jgi:iron only hydrogenase large subunit-like protein/nitrogen-specific signal transduction histidine kinase|nr:[Fe-Fe] hydrogenase large subunit C-terminal domain-containing protein [Elusimicrobiales bacterium]